MNLVDVTHSTGIHSSHSHSFDAVDDTQKNEPEVSEFGEWQAGEHLMHFACRSEKEKFANHSTCGRWHWEVWQRQRERLIGSDGGREAAVKY